MKSNIIDRMVMALVISTLSLVGTSIVTNAQQRPEEEQKQPQERGQRKSEQDQNKEQQRRVQQGQQLDQKQKQDPQQRERVQRQSDQDQKQQERRVQQKQQLEQKKAQQEEQRVQRQSVQDQKQEQRRDERGERQAEQQDRRISRQQQQQLINQQQQQVAQYRRHLEQQESLAREHAAELKRQNRLAQFRYQEEYWEQLRQQQIRLRDERLDYDRDPYFYAAPIYRYWRGDRYYEINRYGANVLRQALNAGYAQGFRAGEADRYDRWRGSYWDCYAYRDANYGYSGYYISRGEYNYYFREGFRRGYEDGYDSRFQYGRYSDGSHSMLDDILSQILNFQDLP